MGELQSSETIKGREPLASPDPFMGRGILTSMKNTPKGDQKTGKMSLEEFIAATLEGDEV